MIDPEKIATLAQKTQIKVVCSRASECGNWRDHISFNCKHKCVHMRSTDCRGYKTFDSDPEPVWRYCVQVHRSVRCVKVKGV